MRSVSFQTLCPWCGTDIVVSDWDGTCGACAGEYRLHTFVMRNQPAFSIDTFIMLDGTAIEVRYETKEQLRAALKRRLEMEGW